MDRDALASRIDHHWWGDNWPNVPNREGDLERAREAVEALGLTDFHVAVERALDAFYAVAPEYTVPRWERLSTRERMEGALHALLNGEK